MPAVTAKRLLASRTNAHRARRASKRLAQSSVRANLVPNPLLVRAVAACNTSVHRRRREKRLERRPHLTRRREPNPPRRARAHPRTLRKRTRCGARARRAAAALGVTALRARCRAERNKSWTREAPLECGASLRVSARPSCVPVFLAAILPLPLPTDPAPARSRSRRRSTDRERAATARPAQSP